MAQEVYDLTDCSTCDSDSDAAIPEVPRHSVPKDSSNTRLMKPKRQRRPIKADVLPKKPVQHASLHSLACTIFKWIMWIFAHVVLPLCLFRALVENLPSQAQIDLARVEPLQVVLNVTQDVHKLRQHSRQLASLTQEFAYAEETLRRVGDALKTPAYLEPGKWANRHLKLGDNTDQAYTDTMLFTSALESFVDHTSIHLEVFSEKIQEARVRAQATLPWYDFWTLSEADRQIGSYLKWYPRMQTDALADLVAQGRKVDQKLNVCKQSWKQLTEWRVYIRQDLEADIFENGNFKKWWGSKKQLKEMDRLDYFAETPYDEARDNVYHILQLLRKCSTDFEAVRLIASAASGSYGVSDIQDSSIQALNTVAARLRQSK